MLGHRSNRKSLTFMGIWLAAVWLCLTASQAGAATLPDFTGLVGKVSPAVVNISTSQKVQMPSGGSKGQDMPEIPKGTPFGDFFRRFFGDPDSPPPEFDSKSLGSGFVISHDGYVLTNRHVIEDADKIVVRLSDRREFDAKVVGSDKRSDIALLKIDAHDLPVVKIGDSDKLKVGEWVLAIGSPFGFDHSVTAGIVSAKGRSLPSENYVPFIQTDVAINPGNSGGPLFNMDGQVVGINSQIYSRTGGFMGLSFAIPINVTMNVVEQLKSKGYVSRGWLGILIQDVTQDLAESFNMKKPMGALVARVLPNSPAAEAGIQVGDVIVGYRGHPVNSSSMLPPMVGGTQVGKTVDIKVIRDGKPKTLHVKIAELPKEKDLELSSNEPPQQAPESVTERRLGISVSKLSESQRKDLNLKDTGVYVEDVDDGPAHQAGIQRGDVILKINGVDIKGVGHLNRLVADLPKDKSVPVLIQRHNSPLFLALKLGDDD